MSKIDTYEKEFILQIGDIDKNNKMKLVSYLKFMQEVGALHSQEYGYGINDEKVTHRAWIVLNWKVEILRRPSWNEKIKVKSWIDSMDKIYYYRDFELLDSNDNVIAKAVSKWIMIDTITKKVQKINEEYINTIKIINREGYNNEFKKISAKVDTESLIQIYEHEVQKRDVDTNNHMNNLIYLDLALEGLDDGYIDNISKIEIDYKTECKYKDKIVFMKKEIEGQNKVYILDENKEKVHALVILE